MGAEIKEDKKITNHEVPDVKMNQGFQFKDPGAYNHLSKEEKEKLTGKMMTFWKKWDKKSTLTTCGKNRISTSLPPHLKE